LNALFDRSLLIDGTDAHAPIASDWHIGHVGRCQILVRDALNSGHVSEAAKQR
jgi:hypothetical protein